MNTNPRSNWLALCLILGSLWLIAAWGLASCAKKGEPFVPATPGGLDSAKVEGYIQSGRWKADKNPTYYYVMPGKVTPTLLPGRTVTIDPGVVVVFTKKGLNLKIQGDLVAVGTSAKPITFMPPSSVGGSPLPGDWGSLIFDRSKGSHLKHVRVLYANTGIIATDADLLVENSTISNSAADGINLTRSNLTLVNCTVANSGRNGITLDACDDPLYKVRIEHCSIGNNVFAGIWSVNSGIQVLKSDIKNNGRLTGNDFVKAFSSGAHFEGLPGILPPTFIECNIENNQPCEVRNLMAEGLPVMADSIFWGYTTGDQMDALSNPSAWPPVPIKSNCTFNIPAICDGADSLGAGRVHFCYWRNEPWPNFGAPQPPPQWEAPAIRVR